MEKFIFTGGLFSLQNGSLKFYCRNKKFHSEEYTETRSFSVEGFETATKRVTNYLTKGALCFCGDNESCSVLEPDRIIPLQHMCALGLTKEIEFYLRSWGYLQLPFTEAFEKIQWSQYEFMQIDDIGSDGFSSRKDRLIGKRIFANKTNFKHITDRTYNVGCGYGKNIVNWCDQVPNTYDFKKIVQVSMLDFTVTLVGTSTTTLTELQ